MQINVDKEDIINMIKGGGTHGSYSWLNWLESNGYARYYDPVSYTHLTLPTTSRV